MDFPSKHCRFNNTGLKYIFKQRGSDVTGSHRAIIHSHEPNKTEALKKLFFHFLQGLLLLWCFIGEVFAVIKEGIGQRRRPDTEAG